MMLSKKDLLILDSDGYPYKISARLNKNETIAKALSRPSLHIQIYSKRFNIFENNSESKGNVGPINFEFLNRKNNNFLNIIGSYFKEFTLLRTQAKRYQNKSILITHVNSIAFIYYFVLAKIFNFKLYSILDEWHPSIKFSKLIYKINAILFVYLSIRYSTGILPISSYLEKKILKKRKSENIFLLPILTDFYQIYNIPRKETYQKYLLFCGGIGHVDIIKFILQLFTHFNRQITENVILELVLSGAKNKIDDLKEEILKEGLSESVMIKTGLEFNELISLYKSAAALLLPMRPTIQDKARFPHKLGQYLACGSPVVTNNWGEISFYLENRVNAYVADSYSVTQFSDLLVQTIVNKSSSEEIGLNGQQTCLNNFDYHLYSDNLFKFLFN